MDNVYTSYPEALAALKKLLAARKFSLGERHIVLAPDRYTLLIETTLFEGGGAFDCEVLTLSRLCRRIASEADVLPREGCVMLIARAISAVKDKLVYYKKAARYNDFAREVYDALVQIASSDADINALEADGITGAKIKDLALINAEYERLKSESLDAQDRLRALISSATDEFITSSHFYAVGYADVTRLNEKVFEALKKNAKSFVRLDVLPLESTSKKLDVYRAPDKVTQYKEVAMDILDYVAKGGRYGDVSVICPEPRSLSRIFREYGIAFYTDISTPLDMTPPLAALSSLYSLKNSDDAASLVALCKNPFSGCDDDDAERLHTYLSERGRKYDVLGDYEITDKGARRARDRAKQLIDMFTGSFPDACLGVIDGALFEEVERNLFPDGTDMITPMRELIALLDRYGSMDFETDAAAFFSAAHTVTVKSLPRRKDCVTVSDASAMRMTAVKKLYITDFNEGVLPTATLEAGVFSDYELARLGGVVEPTAREKNRRDRVELAAVIENASDVLCTYNAGAGKRAAFLENFDVPSEDTEYTYDGKVAALELSDNVGYVVRFAQTYSSAREIAARRLTKYSDVISSVVGKGENRTCAFTPSLGETECSRLSVSELKNWFACPYKRFLKNVVGLKELRRGELTAPDFGIIVHGFMQRFIEDGTFDVSRSAVERIIDGLAADMTYEFTPVERERIISEAVRYAEANKYIIESGEYKPAFTERPFGADGEITFGKVKAKFVGVIDRVDACGDRLRVIDYKTGDTAFDMKKCLCGLDMQLPLYAATLPKDKTVTGVFYVPLGKQYDDDGRMRGCMIKNTDYAAEYDKKLLSGEKSDIIPAKFKFDKKGNADGFSRPVKLLMDGEAFGKLIDVCIKTADVAADEMASGYIERSPCQGACDICAYDAICGNTERIRDVGVDEWTGD